MYASVDLPTQQSSRTTMRYPTTLQRTLLLAVSAVVALVVIAATVVHHVILASSLSEEAEEKVEGLAELYELSGWQAWKAEGLEGLRAKTLEFQSRHSEVLSIDIMQIHPGTPPRFEMLATTGSVRQTLLPEAQYIEAAAKDRPEEFVKISDRDSAEGAIYRSDSDISAWDAIRGVFRPGLTYASGRIVPWHKEGGQLSGVISFEVSLDRELAHIKSLLGRSAAVLLASLLAIGAATWYLEHHWLGGPLRLLSAGIASAKAGDFTKPLAVVRRDEIGALAASYNEMIEGLSASRSEIEVMKAALQERVECALLELEASNRELTAKMEEQRRTQLSLINTKRYTASALMAAGVAHEIGNQVRALKQIAEAIEKEDHSRKPGENDGDRALLDELSVKLDQLSKLAGQFVDHTRPVKLNLASEGAAVVANEAIALAMQEQPAKNITVRKSYATDVPEICVDRQLLVRSLANIVRNSLMAMPAGGTLTVGCEAVPDRATVHIAVEDTGIGIAQERLEEVFDPFATSRPDAIGLGLPIAKRIIEAHDGDIALESRLGKGTCVTISLPTALAVESVHQEA